MSSTQHKHQQQQDPEMVSCGGCGEKPKKGVTFMVWTCGEAYFCNVVSYSHLTRPTISPVDVASVAVS